MNIYNVEIIINNYSDVVTNINKEKYETTFTFVIYYYYLNNYNSFGDILNIINNDPPYMAWDVI